MNDRGVVTRSRQGSKAKIERKDGDIAGSGVHLDNDPSCVFNHGEGASGNGSMPRKQKEPSSSRAQIRRQ